MELEIEQNDNTKINIFYYILYVISNSFPIIPNPENRNKLMEYLKKFKQNNLHDNSFILPKNNENELTHFNFLMDDTIDIVNNSDYNNFKSEQKKENELIKTQLLREKQSMKSNKTISGKK